MKLNNRGFSMNSMLIVIMIFLAVIVFVTILSYNVGIEKDSPLKITSNNIQEEK